MKRYARRAALGLALALAGGCEIDSADKVHRDVGLNVEGVYTSPGGGSLVSQNSGAAIRLLNVRQAGDRLEAVDNNGMVFRGSIGQASGSSASFNMTGSTTAGSRGTISGTFQVGGTQAVLSGTWVEEDRYGTVYGTASVTPTPTNGPGDLAISPPGSISLQVGSSRTFTASGGSRTYTWTLSNPGVGTINPASGASVVYTATAAGTQQVRVSDGSATRTTTVTQ